MPRYTDDELLILLREYIKEHGVPTGTELRGDDSMPSPSTYRTHFGSWREALAAVGEEPDQPGSKGYSREFLLSQYQGLADELGHPPSMPELAAADDYTSPGPYLSEFGSWKHAVEAAGYDPKSTGPAPGASKGGLATGTKEVHPASDVAVESFDSDAVGSDIEFHDSWPDGWHRGEFADSMTATQLTFLQDGDRHTLDLPVSLSITDTTCRIVEAVPAVADRGTFAWWLAIDYSTTGDQYWCRLDTLLEAYPNDVMEGVE